MAETGSSGMASPPRASPDSYETLPQSGRKRSHEDMTETHQGRVPNSSATLINSTQSMGEVPGGSQVVPPSSAHITAPSQHAHSTMPPPPRPGSAASVSSGHTEMSAQAPSSYQPQKEQPTPAVRTNIKSEHHSDSAGVPAPSDGPDSPTSSPSTPPDEGMESFNWDGLIAEYDARMEALDAKENRVMEEFSSLCAYFGRWAQMGSVRELDRSCRRLRTQTTFVQLQEDELERKRLHYVEVVNAFKSALELLSK